MERLRNTEFAQYHFAMGPNRRAQDRERAAAEAAAKAKRTPEDFAYSSKPTQRVNASSGSRGIFNRLTGA
jgi:hypothetical protein